MNKHLLDKITLGEYEMIDYYRNNYIWRDGENGERMVSSKEVLKPWAEAKGDLYRLFGNNLIISKDVEYIKARDELFDDMTSRVECYGKAVMDKEEHTGNVFYEKFLDWVNVFAPLKDSIGGNNLRYSLRDLVAIDNLVNNSYAGLPFEIPMPNGKTFKVMKDTKVMKVLQKLANAYNIDGFEEFRIAQSLVANQKKIKGTLYLSIHPLDYMTMSDNECDWDSCLSWWNEGCYRQGTVEMMNSPIVVEAYVAAKEDMTIADGYWSNKKWRQLFIASPDMLFSIKAYPYHNTELTKTVMNWLKDLAKLNWNIKYTKIEKYDTEKNYIKASDKEIELNFTTDYMYNDVGRAPEHFVALNPDWIANKISANTNTRICTSTDYSGVSECMSCGKIYIELDNEGLLVCKECENIVFCNHCGCMLSKNDIRYHNDIPYCSKCYYEFITFCNNCKDEIEFDEAYTITFFMKTDDGMLHICNHNKILCEYCYNRWLKKYNMQNVPKYKMYDKKNIYIDIEDCSKKLQEEYKNIYYIYANYSFSELSRL